MRNFQNRIRILTLSFCLLFSSCADLFFADFTLENVKVDYELSVVEIRCSSTPQIHSFIKAFSLKENGENIQGDFSFDGNTVKFFARKNLDKFSSYKLNVSQNAENLRGVSLKDEFCYEFSEKTDYCSPSIISISPQNEENVVREIDSISITFSEKIDFSSFESSFRISPSLDYFVSDVSETQTSVIFKEKLKKGQKYQISISTDLKDLQNNHLSSEYDFTFSYFEKNQDFEVDVVQQGRKIEISFSDEVDFDQLANYISVRPEIDFDFEFDYTDKKKAALIFSDQALYGQLYNLKIKNGLSDIYGNLLKEDKIIELSLKDENERYIKYVTGFFQTVENSKALSDWKILNSEYQYASLTFDPLFTTGPLDLVYVFEVASEDAKIDLISAMTSFSISPTNNCASVMILTCKVYSKNEFKTDSPEVFAFLSDDDKEKKLAFVRLGLDFTVRENCGLINFELSSSISDTNGNCLEDSLSFVINKL
ncbi:MAG: Ig-like domain-containing protein [Treponemataceae bacterium]|nr:Ig-like domain-containing protein [Spirochaetales bacterium]MDY6030409.1 Ig-like domain-containing protein [Treponemataceae bacterium]